MEGDIKDIVLARLEKRLKDKDEEIRALKERIGGFEDSDELKALEAKVGGLEDEVREAQLALSEVMKKLGTLEAALVAMSVADGDGGEDAAADASDPDLALDGQSEPASPEDYGPGVAAAGREGPDGAPGKKDAMRFFRMSDNS